MQTKEERIKENDFHKETAQEMVSNKMTDEI
jgi:hypothetical protein